MVKTKRNAFIMSCVSLVLCVAMLAATTMAWFTDTATSSGNRIKAGDLKIDLLMDKSLNGNYTSIKGGNGDIFKEAALATNSNATLWEPGKTQIVYLAVENQGDLAIKYNTYIDVQDNGLVGSLEYALFDETKYSDFANLQNKSWEVIKGLTTVTGKVKAGRTALSSGVLDEIIKGTSNEKDYVALAVHMSEDADNQYQGKDAIIDVTIVATQKDAEKDAFDTTYDTESKGTVPEVTRTTAGAAISSGTDMKGTITLTNDTQDPTVTATIPASDKAVSFTDADGTTHTEDTATKDIVLTLDVVPTTVTSDSVTYDITMSNETDNYTVKSLNKIVKVEINVGTGLKNVKVTHSGTEMTEANTGADQTYSYDLGTGIVTIYTKSFSPFVVSYDADLAEYAASIGCKGYVTLKEAFESAVEGDTIEILNDCPNENMIDVTKTLTINGNGHTVTFTDTSTSYGFTADADGDKATSEFMVTYNNVNVKSKGPGFYAGESAFATVILNNCTVRQGTMDEIPEYCQTALAAACGGTMTVNGGTFTAKVYGAYVFTSGGTINLYDVNITAGSAALKCDSYSATRVSLINAYSGTYSGTTDLSNNWSAPSGSHSEIHISGGTYSNFGWSTEPKQYNWLDSVKLIITGGTFDKDPSEYVTDEYMVTEDKSAGTYTVAHKPISVNGTYYKNMGEVFEKCNKTNGNGYDLSGNNTVVLYGDIEDCGLYIDKDYSEVTIDFNGHTYTVTSSVGSQGTTSQAMHFESTNSHITLKNGTIKVKAGSGVSQSIQNYTNFVAENMTFDFTNVGECKYATVGFNKSATNETFTDCVITLPANNVDFYANGTLTFNNTQTNADIVFDGDPLIFKCDSKSTFGKFRKTVKYTNSGTANEGTITEDDYTIHRANIKN